MARRAAAFGMNLVVWSRRFDGQDRAVTEEEAAALGLETAVRQVGVRLASSPAQVAARCDVLSIHLAASKETKGLVGAELLSHLKPGTFFVNTARGDVVDHDALAQAVKDKGIRVALDVYAAEPSSSTGEFQDALLELPNVYGTHHIGASTDQAQEAISTETVRIVKTFKETGTAPNVVNP